MDMEESVMIAIAAVVVIAAAVVVNDKIDSTGSAWSPTGTDLLKDLWLALALALALGAIIIVCKWLSSRRDLGGGGV